MLRVIRKSVTTDGTKCWKSLFLEERLAVSAEGGKTERRAANEGSLRGAVRKRRLVGIAAREGEERGLRVKTVCSVFFRVFLVFFVVDLLNSWCKMRIAGLCFRGL